MDPYVPELRGAVVIEGRVERNQIWGPQSPKSKGTPCTGQALGLTQEPLFPVPESLSLIVV